MFDSSEGAQERGLADADKITSVIEKGDVKDARAQFENVPLYVQKLVYLDLAGGLVREGNIPEGKELIDRFTEENAYRRFENYRVFARACAGNGNFEEAEEIIGQIKDPETQAPSYRDLVGFLAEKGKMEEAFRVVEDKLGEKSDQVYAYINIIKNQIIRGDIREAEDTLSLAEEATKQIEDEGRGEGCEEIIAKTRKEIEDAETTEQLRRVPPSPEEVQRVKVEQTGNQVLKELLAEENEEGAEGGE